MMSAEKVGILAIKTDEQRSKLVNPGETAFTGEALFVDRSIEEAFPPRLADFRLRLFSQMLGMTW